MFFFYREGKGSPLMPAGSAPAPRPKRGGAFRPHQVRPACEQGTITTVTLGPQPKEAIGSRSMSPVVHGGGRLAFRTTFPVLESPQRAASRSPTGGAWRGQRRSPRRASR